MGISAIKSTSASLITAAKILATSDNELLDKLKAYTTSLKESVQAKDAKLQEVGYKKYMEK